MIIGLTGPQGAGKNHVAYHLVNRHGAKYFSTQTFLEQRLGKGVSKEEQQEHEKRLYENYGQVYIVNQLLKQSKKHQLALLDSIRTTREVDYLKIHGGYLLGVSASPEERYFRLIKKGVLSKNISFDKFHQGEVRESFSADPNKQNIAACLELANVVLKNSGSIESLYQKVDRFMYRH